MPVAMSANPAGYADGYPIYMYLSANFALYKTVTARIGSIVAPNTPYAWTQTTPRDGQFTPVEMKLAVATVPALTGVVIGGRTLGSAPQKSKSINTKSPVQVIVWGIAPVLINNTQTKTDWIVVSSTAGIGHKVASTAVKPGCIVGSSLATVTIAALAVTTTYAEGEYATHTSGGILYFYLVTNAGETSASLGTIPTTTGSTYTNGTASFVVAGSGGVPVLSLIKCV